MPIVSPDDPRIDRNNLTCHRCGKRRPAPDDNQFELTATDPRPVFAPICAECVSSATGPVARMYFDDDDEPA